MTESSLVNVKLKTTIDAECVLYLPPTSKFWPFTKYNQIRGGHKTCT